MDRREFISWVGLGGIVSSFPVAIAACTPKTADSQVLGSPTADGFQSVGTTADLTKNGQILNEKFAAGPVLVIADPARANGVIAVNPTCTHAGCNVEWQSNQTAFVCSCHNSKFAPDGAVQQGPAAKPLATYTAKVEGDAILVKAT